MANGGRAEDLVSIRRNLLPSDVPKNREDFQLIWLDIHIDDSHNSLQIQQKMLELNPTTQFYTDPNRCVDLIKSIKYEHILLIVSEELARDILQQVGSFRKVAAIFIFSDNRNSQVSLLNDKDKAANIFTDQEVLLQSIRDTFSQVEKQSLVFSLFDQKQKSTRDLSKEEASFRWHQFLMIILRKMPHDEQAKNDMLDKCSDYYQWNRQQLEKIDQFRRTYRAADAMQWYTADSFLFRLLNKAFRTEDIELIYSFRFFIIDLCAQLEREHEKWKDSGEITLYRGQQMHNDEFEKLKNGVGKLISTNGFFSTSRNANVAIVFAPPNVVLQGMTGVLFEIHAVRSCKANVMADINSSVFQEESEVLFSIGATFKIKSVKFDATLDLWKVQLVTTEQNNERLQQYLQLQEVEMTIHTPLVYFGALLWDELGQADRALSYFDMLLRTLPLDHPDISGVYNQLGNVYWKKGELNLALANYERAYEIRRHRHRPDNPRIASSLINIGQVCREKGEYDQSLQCYNQALTIYEKNYPYDHVCKAYTIKNIGILYTDKGDYEAALIWLDRALNMCTRLVPDQIHPRNATCLGCVGIVYEKKGYLDRALEYYCRQLRVEEECLPSDHLELSEHLDWIVRIYTKMGKGEQALEFCREKLKLQRETLGEIHPRVIRTILTISDLQTEFACTIDALQTCQEAFLLAQSIYPADEKITIECLAKLSDIFFRCSNYANSLKYRERQLELQRQIYTCGHRNIGTCLNSIGNILSKMGEHAKALDYYNKALAIYEAIYSSDNGLVHEIRDRKNKAECAMSENKKLLVTTNDTMVLP